MALAKSTEISKIEVVGQYKTVQVRTDTVIKEDGTEISRSVHRHSLECGALDDSDNLVDTDISGEDSQVQGICNAVWSDSVKTAYQAAMDAQSV